MAFDGPVGGEGWGRSATRRSLLGAALGLTAVPVSSAAVPPHAHPDAELLLLDAEMAGMTVREDAAWAILNDPADDDPECLHANELTEQVGTIVERIGQLPATTLAGTW